MKRAPDQLEELKERSTLVDAGHAFDANAWKHLQPTSRILSQIWEIVGDLKKSVQAFTRQMLETLNPHQES